ncbi:ABC transporter ATP-binding protein [Curtobacterium sp. MCPF17_031]|nr:ABC transporter ATP-binding protein [Curtobacterium sp. MCBD17_030]PZE34557.1 ABC transporter ATP-binding protein [Curtobacterium sp. MCPF17_031]
MDSVTRRFGHGAGALVAVHEVDLPIARGAVVAVLGPNGAGKTTTIKMASTLLQPSSGSVSVNGVDAVRTPKQARKHLGLVLGGDRGFYMRASALENLRFFATLAGLPRRSVEAKVRDALGLVGLVGRERDRVETYSRGMKQRLHIARAVLNDPVALLLDEPSIGLDPEGARDLRDLVRRLRSKGCGILLTTHHLQEADELADELVVITGGKTVARGSARDIASLGGVDSAITLWTADLGIGEERMLAHPQIAAVVPREDGRGYRVDLIGHGLAPTADFFRSLEITPDWSVQRDVTLEEAYLAFITKVGAA